jgi:hypothetical protein
LFSAASCVGLESYFWAHIVPCMSGVQLPSLTAGSSCWAVVLRARILLGHPMSHVNSKSSRHTSLEAKSKTTSYLDPGDDVHESPHARRQDGKYAGIPLSLTQVVCETISAPSDLAWHVPDGHFFDRRCSLLLAGTRHGHER